MPSSSAPVTFRPDPSGRVQLARTGSGFWRRDHGARFSIDYELLCLMLKNTRLRARPLRVDFMHWSNAGWGDKLEQMEAAGEIDPSWISLESWVEPNTNQSGFGLFSPCAWEPGGWEAIENGIDEISPVIAWEFNLPEDVLDPDTGEIIPAGTNIGPTITGVSLVDRGFFWMDKVRLYSEYGTEAFLYQEFHMKFSIEKLQVLLTALVDAGFSEEEAQAVLSAVMGSAAATPAPETPEPSTETAPAATPNGITAARATIPSKPPAAAKPSALLSVVSAMRNAAKPSASSPTKPVAQGSYAEMMQRVTQLETKDAEREAVMQELLIAELDRQGRLVGIADPHKLLKEAPAYFSELVTKNAGLVGVASPSAPQTQIGSRLNAAVKAASQTEEEQFAAQVSAYREGQAKLGRKLTQSQAIREVEEQRRRQAAK